MFLCEDECVPKHVSQAGMQWSFPRSYGPCEMCGKGPRNCLDVKSGCDWAWKPRPKRRKKKMAKGTRETAVSKVLTPEIVKADVKVDIDDVVSIGLSQAEQALNTELREAKKVRRAAEQKVNGHLKEIEKAVTELAKKTFQKKIDAAVKAIRDLTGDQEASGNSDIVLVMPNHSYYEDVNGTAVAKKLKSGGEFSVELRVGNDRCGRRANVNVSAARKVKITATINKMVAARDKAIKEVKAAGAQVMDVTARLGQFPTLERALRAKVAETKLKTTAEGRKLVEQMTGSIMKQVKALPGI